MKKISRRGEFEKHFICDDGSYIAVSYPHAVHMKVNDEWVESDYPLVTRENRIVSPNINSCFSLSDSAGATEEKGFVHFKAGEYEISWSLSAETISISNISMRDVKANIVPSCDLAKIDRAEEASNKMVIDEVLSEKRSASDAIAKLSNNSKEKDVIIAETNKRIEVVNRSIITDVQFARAMVEYPDALGNGATLRYVLSDGQIKEEIVLDSFAEFESYSMNMDTNGLIAVLQNDNSVQLIDDNGKSVVTIDTPVMYDSKDATSCNIDVSVIQNGSSCIITYTPDAGWLNSPERVWPIVIDPTVYTYSNATSANQIDNYIYEGQDGVLPNNAAYLYTGWKSENGVRKNHILYWRVSQLPTLPSGSKISSATFNIRMTDGTSTMGKIDLYRVAKTWSSSTISWDNRPSGSTYIASRNTVPSSVPRWLSYPVTSAITSAYNSGSFYGFEMRYASYVEDYNAFYSADYSIGNSAYMPYVTIAYSGSESSTTYTVYYNGNMQTSGLAPSSHTWVSGNPVTLRTNVGGLKKNGYTFGGWNTNSSGTGATYTAGGTYFLPNSNMTLYAKWVPIETWGNYKVTTLSSSQASVPSVSESEIQKAEDEYNTADFLYKTLSNERTTATKLAAYALFAVGGGLAGYTDAANCLKHYLDNTGSTYKDIDFKALLKTNTTYNQYVRMREELNEMLSAAEALTQPSVSRKIYEIEQRTDERAVEGKNWLYAIGHYRTWSFLNLEDTRDSSSKYSGTLTYHLEDYYNWDPNGTGYFMGIAITALWELHYTGYARNFHIKSSTPISVSWSTGQRMGGGASVVV